ncbi:AAA family ATPase [Bacillus mangrovi]|uniref:AAA family ATPase n=2 Tax=Metabacillus mangrovi TaxID=1491830 RepID=A0A7X2S992_9BACI|nr:AAA family ATPase [Metabacillus mangrovi]
MVLNESLEKEIKAALMTISNQKKIYEEWGFEEIDNIPKAILNFFGPPGTGKTMAAHAIASYNNSSILALNYSEIESKYVGDAPKKLVQAFEAASKEKAVLFFDEADSFLGKRIADVSSSSDQAINSLRSQLLILLENFEGIVIFATNLVGNYDNAFESRILKHLKFDLPDSRLRKSIIRKMIPVKAPIENDSLTDAQLDELVAISEGLAGRQIKNAILETLTYAAFNNEEVISFKYFKEAFEKLKSNLEFLKSESGPTISFEVKEQLEKRIQKNLDAEKVNSA